MGQNFHFKQITIKFWDPNQEVSWTWGPGKLWRACSFIALRWAAFPSFGRVVKGAVRSRGKFTTALNTIWYLSHLVLDVDIEIILWVHLQDRELDLVARYSQSLRPDQRRHQRHHHPHRSCPPRQDSDLSGSGVQVSTIADVIMIYWNWIGQTS